MKLIVGKRQTGKTIEAIMTSHATGATILCVDEREKHLSYRKQKDFTDLFLNH